MPKRDVLVERIARNVTGMAEDGRLLIASALAKVDRSLANTFPMRRLDMGEANAINADGMILWFEEKDWMERGAGMLTAFKDKLIKDVGKHALVFRLSPTIDFDPMVKDPVKAAVIWVRGSVVPRKIAKQMGQSFQREIKAGPRRWW